MNVDTRQEGTLSTEATPHVMDFDIGIDAQTGGVVLDAVLTTEELTQLSKDIRRLTAEELEEVALFFEAEDPVYVDGDDTLKGDWEKVSQATLLQIGHYLRDLMIEARRHLPPFKRWGARRGSYRVKNARQPQSAAIARVNAQNVTEDSSKLQDSDEHEQQNRSVRSFTKRRRPSHSEWSQNKRQKLQSMVPERSIRALRSRSGFAVSGAEHRNRQQRSTPPATAPKAAQTSTRLTSSESMSHTTKASRTPVRFHDKRYSVQPDYDNSETQCSLDSTSLTTFSHHFRHVSLNNLSRNMMLVEPPIVRVQSSDFIYFLRLDGSRDSSRPLHSSLTGRHMRFHWLPYRISRNVTGTVLAEMMVAGAQLCDIMDRLDPYPFNEVFGREGKVGKDKEMAKVSNMLSMRLTRWRQKEGVIVPGGAVRKNEPKKAKTHRLHNVTDTELSTLNKLSDEQMLVGVRFPYNSTTGTCMQPPAPKGRHEGGDVLDSRATSYQGIELLAPLPADLPRRWKEIYDAAGRPFPTLTDYIESTGVFAGLPKPRFPFPQKLSPGHLNSENPAIAFQHQQTVRRIPPAAKAEQTPQTGLQASETAHTQDTVFPVVHDGWSISQDYIQAINAAAYAHTKRKRDHDEGTMALNDSQPATKRSRQ